MSAHCRRRAAIELFPFALEPLAASIVLKHESAAVDRLMVLTPTPIAIKFHVLATSTALFDVKMVRLIVLIDGPSAAITPDNGQTAAIDFNIHMPRSLSCI